MGVISLGLFGFIYGIALFWTFLLTALIGNVIAESIVGTPSGVNYGMFTTVLSWLTAIAGLVGCFTEAVPTIALLATDIVAVLFTFIAGIVFAAKLGVHSCNNTVSILCEILLCTSNERISRTISSPTILL
jgi:Membrane-associating domain